MKSAGMVSKDPGELTSQEVSTHLGNSDLQGGGEDLTGSEDPAFPPATLEVHQKNPAGDAGDPFASLG